MWNAEANKKKKVQSVSAKPALPQSPREEKEMEKKVVLKPATNTEENVLRQSKSQSNATPVLAPSPAAQPSQVIVSGLKKGDTVVVDGREVKLLDVTRSKTGKHGSSKTHFVAVDEGTWISLFPLFLTVLDGKKIEQILASNAVIRSKLEESQKPAKEKCSSLFLS